MNAQKPTLYFQFHVPNWCNYQVAIGSTEKEAYKEAIKIAGDENNVWGWNKITKKEADEIVESWR